MFKDADVVLLPTNQMSRNVIGKINDKLVICDSLSKHLLNGDCKPHHLYFLSDDKIENGDYYYNSKTKEIHQKSKDDNVDVNYWKVCKKIIATTDKSLLLPVPKELEEYPFSYTQKSLPQPSDSFIEKFLEGYNINTIISKVSVEYTNEVCREAVNYSHRDLENNYSDNPENADEIYICSGCQREYRNPGYNAGKQRYCSYPTGKDVLKIDKNNTITIKKIKESWNRDEVINLFKKYIEDKENPITSKYNGINNWIKENL